MLNLKKASKKDLEVISVPLKTEAWSLKNIRWIVIFVSLVLPLVFTVFIVSADDALLKKDIFLLLYFVFQWIFFFICSINVALYKSKNYEYKMYRNVGLSFVSLSFLLVFVVYEEYISKHLNNDIKEISLHLMLILPIAGFVNGVLFWKRKLKAGFDKKKYKKNTKKNVEFLKMFMFPFVFFVISIVSFWNIKAPIFGIIMCLITSFGLGYGAIMAFLVAYIKKRFPETYLQKNIRKI